MKSFRRSHICCKVRRVPSACVAGFLFYLSCQVNAAWSSLRDTERRAIFVGKVGSSSSFLLFLFLLNVFIQTRGLSTTSCQVRLRERVSFSRKNVVQEWLCVAQGPAPSCN